MTNELKLDLMALSDIGGQPRKLAMEVHRQLREGGTTVPLPLPLADLAALAGIEEIREHETDAFEGALVANPEKTRGAVLLRRGMTPGRARFTLGHELCHFISPYHQGEGGRFECVTRGLNARRDDGRSWDTRPQEERIEIEANEFSHTLLVPMPEFREERQNFSGCDVEHIVKLADTFGVSKEMMAGIYINNSPEKMGVITSHNGRAKRFILPKEFPYLGMKKDMPLPQNSFARAYLSNAVVGKSSELEQVRTDIWLDRRGNVTGLYEQTLAQQQGWAMTMLLVEEAEESEDDDDDAHWNRRAR